MFSKFKGLALGLLGWPTFNPLPFPSSISLCPRYCLKQQKRHNKKGPNTDQRKGSGHQKPYFRVPCNPTCPLCITALLSNPLVSSHCIRKETPPVSQTPGWSLTHPPVPHPLLLPVSPLTPQQGGAPPTPSPDETLQKAFSITWPQCYHWFTFLFQDLSLSILSPFHSISFSFISSTQREASRKPVEFCWTYFHTSSKPPQCTQKTIANWKLAPFHTGEDVILSPGWHCFLHLSYFWQTFCGTGNAFLQGTFP